MERKFQNSNKNLHGPLTSRCTQKFVPRPKMTKNGRLLNMILSYSKRKPQERRFQKGKKKLDLSHPPPTPPKKWSQV